MNLFKAIGTIVQSATTVIVTLCTALNRAAQSTDNVMRVVEIETSILVNESTLESEEKLLRDRARIDALRKQLADELASAESKE